MMGAARKMATVVLFGLLMITVSAGRVSMLTSPTSTEHVARSSPASVTTSSSRLSESTVRTDAVIGCTPKKLARDLVIYCREPVNALMPIEDCCAVAVGTVGRPSCYCLVKEEAAFGMSPLFSTSKMEKLLARCGASMYLNRTLNNPCDRSYDEKEGAESASPQMTPVTGTCKASKASAYVAWVLVAVLALFLVWMVFWLPAQATQVVYVPEIQMARPRENCNEDQGPRASDARAGAASGNDSSDIENRNEDQGPRTSDASAGAASGDDSSDTVSEASEGDVSHTSESPILHVPHTSELILEGKRIRNTNMRFVGGPWVNK